MTTPALLAISHGTSSPAGQAAVEALVKAVSLRLPGTIVRLGHVDVQQPDVDTSLEAIPAGMPVVIVPLLLSAGYHVRVDLIAQSAGRDDVLIAPALGPDPRLVEALSARLGEVRPGPDEALVLAVAGSSDERANEDCRVTARMLGEQLGRAVSVGFLAAADPRLDAAVAEASAAGVPVIVADYLLAPGYFHDLAVTLAGSATVAPPLLGSDEPPASLVDLVVDRYSETAASSQ